ncbi:MAG: TonB-dependent receptor [Acidipila sp.]|nr:TonB-dependent receptor [Acidipila sp.]
MKRRSFKLALFCAAVLLVFTANSVAQQLATLNLTVNDPSGAGVPGAEITLKNKDTGATRTATTGDGGLAVVAGMPPGLYDLTAEHSGLSKRTVPLQLSVGQVATVTLTLSVTAVSSQVEVSAVVQGVDPEKAEVSQVIDTPKIQDLPISGRDFIDFVLLTPSVNIGRSTAVGAQSPFTETVLKLSFSGVRESHTTYFGLDGIDYTTSISGVQRVSPSQDWVQEFRVVASPYTGDNGRNLGSVVNTITKSGTNDVHGSLYEFFRNDNLDAKNLLSAPGFNTLRFNQFGLDVGGPIKRDKIFYFTGYEGQRRAESPIYSSLILHCTDNPGCFGPGSSSINQVKQLLGLQPEVLGSILSVDDYDKFLLKTNALITSSTFLNVAYLFNDSRKQNVRGAAPGEGMPSSYRDNPVRDQTLYGSLIHLFSNRLTSETLMQYGRRTFELIPKGEGLEPAIAIPDLLSSGGFVGSVRSYKEQHVQFAENVTSVHGNHTLKFGGEIQPVWINTQVTLFSPGLGIFSPGCFFGGVAVGCAGAPPGVFPAGTALAFLFLEPRQFFGQQLAPRTLPFSSGLYAGPNQQAFNDSTTLDFEHTLWSLYAQDQWKIRPNFTMTLGLHYDVDTFPSAKEVKIQGNFHPTNYNNIQPRIGLAYAFNGGKSVARAGFGVFNSPFVFSDVLVSWIGASEFSYINQPLLPEFADPTHSKLIGFGASGAVGAPGPIFGAAGFSNFTHNGVYPNPMMGPVLQFPLGYAQRKFDNPFSAQASLELEHQFGSDFFVSVGYQWMHATRLPVYTSINGAPAPGCNPAVTSGCQPFFTPADPNFGFVLYVQPVGFSIYHAGTVSVRKSFTHHFDFLANYTFSKSIDIATTVNLPNTPVNFLHRGADRAVGDNNVPHRFTLAVLGESPNTWNVVLRNFKASLLTNLQSARRSSIVAGFDTNGDLFPFSDRVGTIGRNTYVGDPSYTVDVRLQRTIPFTERFKGDLSLEVFNLLNRANVLEIDHTYGLPDFVTAVPRHYKDGISPSPASGGNPSFGSPKFAGEARQIQLSFRLNF